MKDTILNSFVIAAALSTLLFSAAANLASESEKATHQAAKTPVHVVQLEKTVVTAKRQAPDLQLAAVADH